ncbi:receptor-like protein Cf-9 homolog [Capsicum annuum]|uniref:receptor-like protein Cf-9 homolog n=1 Tax=Capsicum annuum TaxID=4072 RepID=UPI001FB188B9|nr:receptor-like protein Cf-9 homolog [Capsicum annuum]
MQAPRHLHLVVVRRIIRYFRGTSNHGLLFPSGSPIRLNAFSDSDWAGCSDTRRSVISWCMFLGDSLISWKSKKQDHVSKPSIEDEYRAMSTACSKIVWLRGLLAEIGFPQLILLLSMLTIQKKLTVDSSASSDAYCEIVYGQMPHQKTSSWNMSNNCCSWDGVTCDEMTGHVIELDLRCSQIVGKIDSNSSLFQLSHLQRLDLSYNDFSGSHLSPKFGSCHVDVSLFSEFKYLSFLDLSYNSTSFTNENKVIFTWLESLDTLLLAACEVKELEFLRSAKQLGELDLSNNKLQGRIPDWAWSNWMFSMQSLNLSHNMLPSVDSIPLQHLDTIDLRYNLLQGSLPISPNLTRYFFISENNLSEEIPSSICNLTSLVILDLGRNNSRGEIPQCLGNITALTVLDIRHNNISGNLPRAFSNGCSLTRLNLHGNKLEGKIPRSLANCKELQVLDLGDNHLIGTFPMCLGTLPKLQVLSLRSNELHGSIRTPTVETIFPNLRMLDLTSNGLELEVVRILSLYTTVNLSNNKFEGHIPSIVGDLVALRVLNLCHNRLEGHIPPSLGNLSVVESLDLSGNHLVGEIPAQFSSLTYLKVLNLSHNYLQGCILQGPQFATFENNSYEGNDGLCGFPVSQGCGNDHVSNTVSGLDDQESDFEFLNDFWKAALMGYGSGLCIGLSIIYIMISTRNPIWLARIILKLEHKIIMRRKKKQRRLRNNRRRNNPL